MQYSSTMQINLKIYNFAMSYNLIDNYCVSYKLKKKIIVKSPSLKINSSNQSKITTYAFNYLTYLRKI